MTAARAPSSATAPRPPGCAPPPAIGPPGVGAPPPRTHRPREARRPARARSDARVNSDAAAADAGDAPPPGRRVGPDGGSRRRPPFPAGGGGGGGKDTGGATRRGAETVEAGGSAAAAGRAAPRDVRRSATAPGHPPTAGPTALSEYPALLEEITAPDRIVPGPRAQIARAQIARAQIARAQVASAQPSATEHSPWAEIRKERGCCCCDDLPKLGAPAECSPVQHPVAKEGKIWWSWCPRYSFLCLKCLIVLSWMVAISGLVIMIGGLMSPGFGVIGGIILLISGLLMAYNIDTWILNSEKQQAYRIARGKRAEALELWKNVNPMFLYQAKDTFFETKYGGKTLRVLRDGTIETDGDHQEGGTDNVWEMGSFAYNAAAGDDEER